MSYPRGIVICRNTVLLSQYSNCILAYQLDGKFISRIGSRGSGELQFNDPWGLSSDATTIVFKLSLSTFNTGLNLVKIFSTTLVMSNSTKTISLS